MKTIIRFIYKLVTFTVFAGVIIAVAGLVKLKKAEKYIPQSSHIVSRGLDLSAGNCNLVPSSKFIPDYEEYKCKPSYGYSVLRYMSDYRDSIIISTPEKKTHDLLLDKTVTMGGYSELGPHAEWRMVRKNGNLQPVALIVPVAITGFHEKSKLTHKHWFLGIAKVTNYKICITDVIASESGNLTKKERNAARAIADRSQGKKCK